ncbi:MAG: hypothetical protein WCE30_19955 [Mycobacterium sp.]
MHSARGVTADATHAVLGEHTTRSVLYVATTRARDANTAYLYERTTEQEYGPTPSDGPQVMQRGTSEQADQLARAIIATRDDVPVTAHEVATATERQLIARTRGRPSFLDEVPAVEGRRTEYTQWQQAVNGRATTMARSRTPETDRSRTLNRDSGLEL